MPYPAGHRERIRNKIVRSARRIFNQNGFENVSIDEVGQRRPRARRILQIFREQGRALYRGAVMFLHRPTWTGFEIATPILLPRPGGLHHR
jgi:hypothetical protein